jgi:hypothetical protein
LGREGNDLLLSQRLATAEGFEVQLPRIKGEFRAPMVIEVCAEADAPQVQHTPRGRELAHAPVEVWTETVRLFGSSWTADCGRH